VPPFAKCLGPFQAQANKSFPKGVVGRGSFIVSNDKRQSYLSTEEFWRRLTQAVAFAGQRQAILIRSRPVTVEDQTSSAPNLSVALLRSFTHAPTDENFWIYRISEKQPP
jgi:hypothetical protein